MHTSQEQSLKDKVKLLSKEKHKTFNEVWKNLILERFLVRLSNSPYKNNFIFKGGMLLSKYIELDRETIDLDFSIKRLKIDVGNAEKIIKEITLERKENDFNFSDITISELPHPHMKYPGVRVSMSAVLGKTKTPFSIDISAGDEVESEIKKINLSAIKNKPLFEESITLPVYPVEYIFSEKLEAAIRRHPLNSRVKDYHDMILLINAHVIDIKKLTKAIEITFKNRKTKASTLPTFNEKEFTYMNQQWKRHRNKLGSFSERVPDEFSKVVEKINLFLQPILE